MKFIDFHCDTATLILEENQELKKNNLKIDIEKLQKGEALAQFFAMYIDAEKVDSSYEYCLKMLNKFKNELEKNKDAISLCQNYDDLINAQNNNKIAAFLSIEEGDALEGNLDKLHYFKEQGISAITLTWNYENDLGYPNFAWEHQHKGLKPKGIEALGEMNRLKMLIDVSHLSDAGFDDVLKYSKQPIIATHSNARALTHHTRNLSDEQLKKIANTGSVVALAFSVNFLIEKEFMDDSRMAKVEDMVKHMKHIRNVAGIEVLALGSDFDGIVNPVEIEDASQMHKLCDGLLNNGFSYDEVEKIFYGNGLRIIQEVLT